MRIQVLLALSFINARNAQAEFFECAGALAVDARAPAPAAAQIGGRLDENHLEYALGKVSDPKARSLLEDAFLEYGAALEEAKKHNSAEDILFLENQLNEYFDRSGATGDMHQVPFNARELHRRLKLSTEALNKAALMIDELRPSEQQFSKTSDLIDKIEAKIEAQKTRINSDPRTQRYITEAKAVIDRLKLAAQKRIKDPKKLSEYLKKCDELKENEFIKTNADRSGEAPGSRQSSLALHPSNIYSLLFDLAVGENAGDATFSAASELKRLSGHNNLEIAYTNTPLPLFGQLASDQAILDDYVNKSRYSKFGIIEQHLTQIPADEKIGEIGNVEEQKIASARLQSLVKHYSDFSLDSGTEAARAKDGGANFVVGRKNLYPSIGLKQREVEAHIGMHFTGDDVIPNIDSDEKSRYENDFKSSGVMRTLFSRLDNKISYIRDKDTHSVFPFWISPNNVFETLDSHTGFQSWRTSEDSSTNSTSSKDFNLKIKGETYTVRVASCRSRKGCVGGYTFGEIITVFPVKGPKLIRYAKDPQSGILTRNREW